MRVPQFLKIVEKFTVDNSPLILTALGAAGTITTAVLTGRASYKAAHIIIKENLLRYGENNNEADELTVKEKFQLVWPLFIPPVASAAMTVTAIIMANRIGTRRAAAMAAAYTILERTGEEYREKIIEKFGANKEREARDDIAQDRVRANPVGRHEVIITGGGDILCYDLYTGRYFKSSIEAIKKAVNDTNYQIINSGYASLNDFYNRVGLSNTETGDEVGWNGDALIEPIFSTTISDDDRPCITLSFHVRPARSYFRTH
jgi:hypothetical protein